jgi:hypothetical protein
MSSWGGNAPFDRGPSFGSLAYGAEWVGSCAALWQTSGRLHCPPSPIASVHYLGTSETLIQLIVQRQSLIELTRSAPEPARGLSFLYGGNSERLQGLLGRRSPRGTASMQPPL